MNPSLLSIIVCPETLVPLELVVFEREERKTPNSVYEDIISGILKSSTGFYYPIIDGVPRLLDGAMNFYKKEMSQHEKKLKDLNIWDECLKSPSDEFKKLFEPTLLRFNKEWKEHDIDDKTWGWDQDERLKIYKKYMGLEDLSYNGKLFLDLGAGTGQLTCTVSKNLDCEIIGLDLTPSVLKSEKRKVELAGDNAYKCHFIQANLMKPPFRNETFDFIHASGVLHHTPSTKSAFDKIVPLVKHKGRLGVWLYRPSETLLPLFPFLNKYFVFKESEIRKISTKLNPTLLYLLIKLYVSYFQFFYKLNELIRKKPHLQTIKARTTSLFDALAPTYAFKQYPENVKQWYIDSDFSDILETDQENKSGFNICGSKN